MNGLMILIPAALFLGVVGLFAFLWSLRSGQYDDLDGAAVRILSDGSPDRTGTRPQSMSRPALPSRNKPDNTANQLAGHEAPPVGNDHDGTSATERTPTASPHD